LKPFDLQLYSAIFSCFSCLAFAHDFGFISKDHHGNNLVLRQANGMSGSPFVQSWE